VKHNYVYLISESQAGYNTWRVLTDTTAHLWRAHVCPALLDGWIHGRDTVIWHGVYVLYYGKWVLLKQLNQTHKLRLKFACFCTQCNMMLIVKYVFTFCYVVKNGYRSPI
jgi:hypothetical protein